MKDNFFMQICSALSSQVPEQSKLLGYEQQGLPVKGVYVSSIIPRDLRQGAEVECTHFYVIELPMYICRKR